MEDLALPNDGYDDGFKSNICRGRAGSGNDGIWKERDTTLIWNDGIFIDSCPNAVICRNSLAMLAFAFELCSCFTYLQDLQGFAHTGHETI